MPRPDFEKTVKQRFETIGGRRSNVRFEIVFDLALLLVCATVLNMLIIIYFIRQDLPRRITPRTVHIADLYSELLTSCLEKEVFPACLERLVSRSQKEDFLALNYFANADGFRFPPSRAEKELVQTTIQRPTWDPQIEKKIVSDGPRSWMPGFSMVNTIYYLRKVSHPKDSGYLVFTFAVEDLRAGIDHSKPVVLAMILLTAIIIVTFGYFLLGRTIIDPLKRLVKAVAIVKEGNYSYRLPSVRRDEVGDLIDSINSMAASLASKQREVDAHIKNLEKLNQDLKTAQAEIIQAEKLASVGRLAAGVAHEVGNPLGAILGYVEIVRSSFRKEDEETDLLNRIEVETNRISKIIRALLNQARSPAAARVDIMIKDLFEDCLKNLDSQGALVGVEIKREFQDPKISIKGDPDQIKQVYFNLIQNAVQAMAKKNDEKRVLYLSARRIGTDDVDIGPSLKRRLKADAYVEITVADSGHGIPPEIKDKIFEPFFTTKEPGEGTGLGLHIARSIVETFRGFIKVESKPNMGARFTTYFPT